MSSLHTVVSRNGSDAQFKEEMPTTGPSPSTTTGNIEDFQYLANTYHIDPEDGLLYETTRVEEDSFANQGTLLWVIDDVFP
jgi:hypothetical protein